MSNEFEPYAPAIQDHEFHNWEVKDEEQDAPVEVRDQEEEHRQELEKAIQDGRESGYQEGLAQAQEEINQLKAKLGQWLQLMHAPMQLVDDQLIQQLVQISLWLTKTCIGVELSLHPEKLQTIYSTLKEEWEELTQPNFLAMNPEDLTWLQENLSKTELKSLQSFLTPDPAMSRGDFYLKGEFNELDGRLQTRMENLFSSVVVLNKE